MPVSVSPHDFAPMRRFFNRGRCRGCYISDKGHPVIGWTLARPMGDKRFGRELRNEELSPQVWEWAAREHGHRNVV